MSEDSAKKRSDRPLDMTETLVFIIWTLCLITAAMVIQPKSRNMS